MERPLARSAPLDQRAQRALPARRERVRRDVGGRRQGRWREKRELEAITAQVKSRGSEDGGECEGGVAS